VQAGRAAAPGRDPAAVQGSLTSRLFIAAPPPAAIRRQLATFAAKLGNDRLRLVPAVNLHVTVLFLGEVEDARVEELVQRLAWVAGRETSFQLAVGHALPAPPRRPRMLWALVAPSQPLLRLSRDLHAAARPLAPGLAKPLRGYGHITLARFRPPLDGLEATTLVLDPDAFAVTEVSVMRSLLSPTGATYDTVASLPLAAE
jgi:RNA 2',3'-cyclic 3'-phosphodiesterase